MRVDFCIINTTHQTEHELFGCQLTGPIEPLLQIVHLVHDLTRVARAAKVNLHITVRRVCRVGRARRVLELRVYAVTRELLGLAQAERVRFGHGHFGGGCVMNGGAVLDGLSGRVVMDGEVLAALAVAASERGL
jgi:hypothetical protein